MTPCLCKKSIVIHDAMCYNIITVKERNKPKSKTLYLIQVSLLLILKIILKSGKAKMKRVDNCITKKSG